MRQTVLAFVALAAALGAPAAVAQSPLEQVYESLELLQDANLGIARQMAELEQQSASELEAHIQQGRIGSPASQAIARTFVANARTLAAIMLSPMQTYQTAAGESMFVLLRRNIEMLRSVTSYRAADPALDAAITRYTVLQMQTQDMAQALQNGWTRYGDILESAERSGLLAANAFDSETQSWALGNPVLGGLPAPSLSSVPAASTAPATEAVAAAEEPATPEAPSLAATVTPLQVPEIAPRPTTTADVPATEPEPVPATEPVPEASSDERLTPNGPLDVADTPETPAAPEVAEPPAEPAAPTTTRMGDWIVTTNAGGEIVATAGNLVPETRDAISSLSMACAPDRSVAYAIIGAKDFPAFRVFSDRSANVTVGANSNVILGSDAVAMADALSNATSWAQQVADSGRSLTIRSADAEGVLALFSPSGYLDARAAMISACANPGEPLVATGVSEPEPPVEEPAATVVEPEPAEAEPASGGVTPPVPAPPIDRSRIRPPTQTAPPAQQPRTDGPVPLM